MTRYHADQGNFDLPAPERPPPDFTGDAREELAEALALAKAAVDVPPWDYRKQGYWRIVFRQMSGWLPAAEAFDMNVDFYGELERIERLFTDEEKGKANG